MDIRTVNSNLPTTIEDLSKFVLVGREKLVSVRAEIRAIDKMNLAKEVREQKKEECLMLSEALLDAEVKLGELTKVIPKQVGGDRKSKDYQADSNVALIRTKKQVITNLGFNEKQVERFETLADNKDLVEFVKAEARENDDIPTRTRVLDLAKQRKERERKSHIFGIKDFNNLTREQFDECINHTRKYQNAISKAALLDVSIDSLRAWNCILSTGELIDIELESINIAIQNLIAIQNYFKGVRKWANR